MRTFGRGSVGCYAIYRRIAFTPCVGGRAGRTRKYILFGLWVRDCTRVPKLNSDFAAIYLVAFPLVIELSGKVAALYASHITCIPGRRSVLSPY